MKISLQLALSVILLIGFANAEPGPQNNNQRREITNYEKWNPKLLEIKKNASDVLYTNKRNLLKPYIKLFEDIVDQAEKSTLKSHDLAERLEEFYTLIDDGKKLFDKDFKDDESKVQIDDLFYKIYDLKAKYMPTIEETLLRGLFVINRVDNLGFMDWLNRIKLHDQLEKHVGEYIAGLTNSERTQESKLIDWYEKFKTTKDVDRYTETITQFFELFEEKEYFEEYF